MSGATVICHGCGQAFAVPAAHGRNKIQCPGCGVICPVPAEAPGGGRPAEKKTASPRPAPPTFDPLGAEPIPAPKPMPEPEPLAGWDPFAEDALKPVEEPPAARPAAPASAEMLFNCRRCGTKVRRQGECPYCDGAPRVTGEAPPITKPLELGEPARQPEASLEDSESYLLKDKELPRCPKCHKEMAVEAVVCVACGYDRRRKKKLTKEYQPLARSWETNQPLRTRLTAFLAIHGASLVLGGVAALAMGRPGVVGFLLSWLFFGAVMAFLMGTYEKIDITRDRKGRVTLTKTWRFCFYPLQPRETDVRGFGEVITGQSYSAGVLEWLVFFSLLPGLISAIVWYYFVLGKNHYRVALAVDHGYPVVYAYNGRSEEQMKEIASVLSDASGLPLAGG
jgi:hypothetical protein